MDDIKELGKKANTIARRIAECTRDLKNDTRFGHDKGVGYEIDELDKLCSELTSVTASIKAIREGIRDPYDTKVETHYNTVHALAKEGREIIRKVLDGHKGRITEEDLYGDPEEDHDNIWAEGDKYVTAIERDKKGCVILTLEDTYGGNEERNLDTLDDAGVIEIASHLSKSQG